MNLIPNIHNDQWALSRMDTNPIMQNPEQTAISNGHNHEWTRSRIAHPKWISSRMATIPNEYHLKSIQSRMDTFIIGHDPKWTPFRKKQSQMDSIPNGHHLK